MALTVRDAAAELLARRQARASFLGYARYMQPEDQQPVLHHQLICDELDAVERGETERLILMLPPGSAKALALDTPIPTPAGWATMGSLAVGDEVFDENGNVCRVTWKSPVWKDRPVYSVTTDCGDEIVADHDHEWLVRLCGKPRKPLIGNALSKARARPDRDDPLSQHKIKETWELARDRSKRPMIKRAGSLATGDITLPIDPYVLGVWLGDGTHGSGAVTSSIDDQPYMRAEIERLGYKTSDRSAPTLFGVLGIRGALVELGLLHDPLHGVTGVKMIPGQYMRASHAQRLALIQGLVDTDGTVCKKRGMVTFCNTNKKLAEQFRELVRSVGRKAGWSVGRAMLNGKDCGEVYRVSFYHAEAARMPRKRELCRDQHRTPNTYIDVAPAGYADTVCIEVDSKSHLFLCGQSMTPTHNSTYGSVLFPQYFLGRNPQLTVIGASHTADLANRFSRRVRNGVGSQEFHDVFPTTCLAADAAAAGSWETNQNGEYKAAGVGGAIAGRRADLVIIDDPVKSREEADSELVREKIWQWYLNDLRTRLKPGARVVLIMTRWHEADLAGRLLEHEKGRWKVVKVPMLAGQGDPLGRQPGELLWPEWFTQQMLEDAQADPRSWISLYQQEPRPIEGAEFKTVWVNRYDHWPKDSNRVLLCDPSGGKKRGGKPKGDYTSMWVVALGRDHNAYVVDGVRARLNLTERTDALFELHKKWRPMQTRYEAYGMQADIEHIKTEMERREYRFKIWEMGGGVQKEARIRRLIPWFEGGKIWLPHTMLREVSPGVVKDIVKQFLEEEYATFPVGRFDDAFDNLARLAEPKPALPWPSAKRESDDDTNPIWSVMDAVAGY